MQFPRYRITVGGILFGIALAITGTAAFFTGNNLIFLIFSAMLALLLVSGFVSRLVLAGLELELLLPEHVCARTATPARIRLKNLKRITPSFSIEVAGSGIRPVYFPVLPGGGAVEAPVEVTFDRRGKHGENLFSLSTAFPFGFIRRTSIIALRRDTIVYPAMQPTSRARQLMNEGGASSPGVGQDFYRIRPYLADDSARSVDWKSTAHTGELQVREFAKEDRRHVEIDLDRSAPSLEQNLEECTWLVWHLTEENCEIAFRSQGCELDEPFAILHYLALAEPCASARRDFDAGDAKGGQIVRLP